MTPEEKAARQIEEARSVYPNLFSRQQEIIKLLKEHPSLSLIEVCRVVFEFTPSPAELDKWYKL